MCGGQTVGYPHQQLHNLQPAPLLGAHPTFERAAVDEFSDEVLASFEFTGVVNSKNVWMVQRGCHLRFTLEAAARTGIGQIIREKLYGDRSVEFGVERAINNA